MAGPNGGKLALQDLLQNARIGQTTSPCATTTPVKITTSLAYLGAFKADFNDQVMVTAMLTDDMGAGINLEPITFTLNASESVMRTTGLTGTASCPVTPGEAAGPYTVKAMFFGDTTYSASSASATFTVLLEETAITSSPIQQLVQQGGTATFSAVLTDPDGGAPIQGKLVKITLSGSGGSQSCTGRNHISGTAPRHRCTSPRWPRPQTVTDPLPGDAHFVG